MDPLSDVLSLLKPRNVMCRGFDLGGAWAFRFGQWDGIKCYAVVSGRCWLAMEGLEHPLELNAGDCFLLPSGLPFGIGADHALRAVDAMQTICSASEQGVGLSMFQGGGDCFIVGGHFTFTGGHAGLLTSLLPSIVHVRSESGKTEWRWALDRMREELQGGQPGCQLVAQQIALMILVQALRLHLAEQTAHSIGWLFAIADKSLKLAIECMHENPSHPWTLQELAKRAGMSRSLFAKRFKGAVGETPMEYLTRWRMHLASDRLLNTADSVTVVALSLGYSSESAFRRAFRKVIGCPPRRYRQGAQSAQLGAPTHNLLGAG